MGAEDYSVVWNAKRAAGGAPIAAYSCVVKQADGTYIPSTLANRTAVGRLSAGFARSSASGRTVTFNFQFCGIIGSDISGLGVGAATTIHVGDDGLLARGSSGDVVGRCDADGTAYVLFGGLNVGGGGGTTAPGGSDKQVQFNDGGAFGGAASWLYNKVTGSLTAAAAATLLITNAAGTGTWTGIVREGTGANESVSINGDAAGDANASAPNLFLQATALTSMGMNDASSFLAAGGTALGGVAYTKAFPGLSINGSGTSTTMFGGGTGVLAIRTSVAPSAGTPPSASFGTGVWADSSTTQLLTVATVGGSGDIAPLSSLYASVVFASDASRNLTTAESRATAVVVSGTITATRTLTNTAMRPTASHLVFVQNNCAQSVTYAWSSGTGITVAAGTGAVISGDGTNAVLVSTFQLAAGGVTWANDLAGSSSTHQWIAGISGSGGAGGTVPIVGGVTLQFGSAGGGIINVATVGSGTGTGLTIQAGGSSSGAGAGLDLKSGVGTTSSGNLTLYTGATARLQLADSGAAGDLLVRGANTFVAFAKGSNSTVLTTSSGGTVAWAQVALAMLVAGSNGQFLGTTGGVAAWGNTGTFFADTATPATTGSFRAGNGTNALVVRNSGNSADIVAVASTSNDVYLGSDATGAALQATNVRCYPSSAGIFGVSNVNYFVWQTSQLLFRQPALFTSVVGGDSSTSAAFRWAAASITTASGTTVTATAAQYSAPFLTLTGTGGSVVLPNTTGAVFFIKNSASTNVICKAAGQIGVNISNNNHVIILCDGTDYAQYGIGP